MDRISINNIFNQQNNFQPLDANNIYDGMTSNNKIKFDIDRLITLRDERKKKIISHYEKLFNVCLNKISMANEMNKTEIIYDIPRTQYGHPGYNKYDCLEYIEKKIREIKLDVLILDDLKLYISWLNLEENINQNSAN